MYAKGKGSTAPSDAQAREKLALYVYEYLLHTGAQKSAQTFLSEIRWEKNITLGEPPGFLHSWWCVFWDLYCAAPERRDTCEHSSEAKAFHDYGFVNPGYGMNGNAHNPHMRHPSPTHPASQMSPHPMHGQMMSQPGQPFLSPRYPGPRGLVRMPPHMDFTTFGLRGPPQPGMGPGGPNMGTAGGGNMTPIPMGGPNGGRSWPPSSQGMIYNAPSPGNFNGPVSGTGAPGTPIMPSPQDSTHSGDNMYGIMKPNMPFPMTGPESVIGPMGPDMPRVMNGQYLHNERLVEGMKNSPHNGGAPGTPRDDVPPNNGDISAYNSQLPYPQENLTPNHSESAEILKIKQSMQEEARRFEKDTPPDPNHPDFFMQ
ncbi:hypothetical protein HELRODRAFT_156925 [Helobdella robusta]|uniref:Uncharacterized protein n=1 Tax=Helobdella robusta TaxID=6412 RepID=T1EM33_HELRO|nr:hypothetical protein HELRODRAFT_156925 [Helobdella robusta]ESO05045.1 hypothetical protein HELRODRAFT_156925 [Helobdella robusta]